MKTSLILIADISSNAILRMAIMACNVIPGSAILCYDFIEDSNRRTDTETCRSPVTVKGIAN